MPPGLDASAASYMWAIHSSMVLMLLAQLETDWPCNWA